MQMDGLPTKLQTDLLTRIERGGYSPSRIVSHLWRFLEDKSEEEPLDPKWIDIWGACRATVEAMDYAPDDVITRIDEAIAAIRLVDEEVWGVKVTESTNVTFLLGAGASAPSGIPTVDQLLPELWKRASRIGREDLDALNEWCQNREITNIEDLLTAAYISNFAVTNPNMTALLGYFLFAGRTEPMRGEEYVGRRERVRGPEPDVSSIRFLQDTLQTLFGLLASTMIPTDPNAAHKGIVHFVKTHTNKCIITTNYDGCMDEAILQAKPKLGLRGTLGTLESEQGVGDGNSVELIKMHGSINWAYCESCQDAKEFDLLELKKAYTTDTLSYPVIGICQNCGGQRRPLLVPPLSFKLLTFPPLVDMWNTARERIDKAEYLVVVGYSFSEADTYMTNIIWGAMSQNETQKMVVVNSDPGLVPSLRGKFSKRIDGFDEKRILQVCENCEDVLPRLLRSMLGEQEMSTKPKQKKKRKSAS